MQTHNLYRIDTNYIFVEGGSAGGITASQVAYLDSSDNIPSYIMNLITANGGFKGNSSTNTSYSTPIKGVINYSGALWRKDWINIGEPALFSVHDDLDTIVPCNYGLSKAQPFPVYFYGSCAMQQEANLKGVYNDIYINNNSSGHMAYFGTTVLSNTVLQYTSNFLYDILCNNILSIKDQEKIDSKIQLYPNPANYNLTIEAPQDAIIEITNIHGQLIKTISLISNKTSSTCRIDVSSFPSGVYFVEVKTEKGVVIKKLLKE